MKNDFAKTFFSQRYGQILAVRDFYEIGRKSDDPSEKLKVVEIYYREGKGINRIAVKPTRQSQDAIRELFDNLTRTTVERYIDEACGVKQEWPKYKDNVRFL